MHAIKNVFDNMIGILLDIPRKSKDGLKSHTDLVQFELRPELHPILRSNGKYFLPSASYMIFGIGRLKTAATNNLLLVLSGKPTIIGIGYY
jgi:hypothetical protein